MKMQSSKLNDFVKESTVEWKYHPLAEIDSDIGWNDLSCWASIFFLVAHGFLSKIELSDCLLADEGFYPQFIIGDLCDGEEKSVLLHHIEREFDKSPFPSAVSVLDPFIKHHQWNSLINNFSYLGIHFQQKAILNIEQSKDMIPYIAFVNTLYLPYWPNDFLLNAGGLYKYQHCLLVCDCNGDDMKVQDPSLKNYDGILTKQWLRRAMAVHTGMPKGWENTILKVSCRCTSAIASRRENIIMWRCNLIETLLNKLVSRGNSAFTYNLKESVFFLLEVLNSSSELAKEVIPAWVRQQLMYVRISYNGLRALATNKEIDIVNLDDSQKRMDIFLETLSRRNVLSLADVISEFNQLFDLHIKMCVDLLTNINKRSCCV